MEKIEKLLEMNASQCFKYIENYMDSPHYFLKDDYRYYPSDKSSLLLCAHVDTVRKDDKPFVVKRIRNILYADQSVLGADDRAGVWALLEIKRRCIAEGLTVPALLFTNYEESGGTGMLSLTKAQSKYFKNIHLAIAMDRMGVNEYVTYNHLPYEVSRYMESFGYIKNHGTFNDITYFTESYRIPSVNVSVGYYNAHTIYEKLHYDELLLSIGRIMEIVKNPIGKRYKTKKETLYSDYSDNWRYEYDNTNGNTGKRKKGGNGNTEFPILLVAPEYTQRWCMLCEDNEGVRYVDEHDYTTWVCEDCYTWIVRDNPNYENYNL